MTTSAPLDSVGLVQGYDVYWPDYIAEDGDIGHVKEALTRAAYEKRRFDKDCGLYKLYINLNAPDAVLEKDFKKCLKDIRVRADKEKQIANPQKLLEKILNAQVVPYLDLTLWGRQNKINFTDNLIGNWLYPDELGIDTKERIRQTTRPLADKAISNRFSIALRLIREQDLSHFKPI